jgi:hypothetical protein
VRGCARRSAKPSANAARGARRAVTLTTLGKGVLNLITLPVRLFNYFFPAGAHVHRLSDR